MLGQFNNPTLNGTVASSANAGADLSNLATQGVSTGLNGLASFNPFSSNNTDALTKGTNAFLSGLNIPGQVAAGMVPAEQAAAYGLSPQIDANAAADGANTGSRAAIEHGVLGAQLGQQANALTQQLTASGYNTGAGLTEQQLQSNNQNALAALLGQTQGGAAAANAGTAANAGAIANQTGINTNASAGATGQNSDPFQALQNFYNIIGSHNWGNSTQSQNTSNTSGTSTTTYDPSQMSQIGAWTNFVGSLF